MNRKLKNIFIIGPSRCGKTSLASKLQKYGYNHIVMDAIIETMNECFPETNIKHGNLDSPEFKKFLKSFCKNNFKYGLPYIIDLEVLPTDFDREFLNEDESSIVYLGYPNISIDEKMRQIREHDTKFDWTRNITDDELKEIVNRNIQTSKKIQEDAKANNYIFLDTSYDRENVFNNFIKTYLEDKENNLFDRTEESYDRYIR